MLSGNTNNNTSSSLNSQIFSQRKIIPTESEADPFSLFVVDDLLQVRF